MKNKLRCKIRRKLVFLIAVIIFLLGVSVSRIGQKDTGIWKVQAFAQAEEKDTDAEEETQTKEKEETVYAKADAQGNVQELTVEAVLKKEDGEEIEDYSTLHDIKNQKGDEEFTLKDDGTIIWENKGEDIHYEGKSDKELPVSVKVTYYLDGEKISPEKLAGKSGKVRIRFDYTNKTSKTVKADGQTVKVQVPFLALSTVFLPEDTFSNVSVTNGKVISMDEQNVVAGYACPGLADSLKLTAYEPTEDMDIPDYVEVTADANDFELGFTATVVTTGMFEDIDTKDLSDADDLTEDMGKLSDASGELVDGTSELLKGTKTMQSYLAEYTKGVSAADKGAEALKDSLKILNEKKGELEKGAESLETGLTNLNNALNQITLPSDESLSDNTAQSAAEKLGTDAAALAETLKTLSESLEKLQTTAASASSYADTVKQSVKSAKDSLEKADLSGIDGEATQKAREQAGNAVEAALKDTELTQEQKAQIKESVAASIEINGMTSDIQEQLNAAKNALDTIPEFQMPEIAVNTGNMSEVIADMEKQLDVLSAWGKKQSAMADHLKALSGALTTLKSGAKQLETGSSQLTTGITAFNQGVLQIYKGAVKLKKGTNQLSSAGKSLDTGFDTLIKGMKALRDGVTAFDEKGIQNLSDLAGDDLNDVIVRFKALKKAEKKYQNFSGIQKGKTGSVKFVIETEEIKKD